MTRSLAAALAVVLALSGCASTDPAAPGGTPPAPATGGEAGTGPGGTAESPAPGGEPTLVGGERAVLYRHIDSLTKAWQVASSRAGRNALVDAHAAETAVAREVWNKMDTVLADLEGSENPRWRIIAAKGLGFVNDPRIRPALERTLVASDARLLSATLVSLARIGAAETGDGSVIPLLRFPDPVVRGNAALCLARVFQARRQQGMEVISPAERVDEVEADLAVLLFEKDDAIVRANAAQALGGLGTPGAEDALLNRLRDEAGFVRLKAAQALAFSGTSRSLSPLLDAMGRETEENVRVMLALALGSISERQGLTPPHSELGTDAARWRAWLQR